MIEIKNLSKSYENYTIFHNLTVTLYNNKINALVGVNGIGKSTLLNSITQSAFKTAGDILIDCIPNNIFESRYHFFFIPDHKDMFLNLTGIEYLSFIIKIYNRDFKLAIDNAHKITKQLKISESLNKTLSSYSLGMKQKIYLTGALISGASNLILDEPFNGLDPDSCIIIKKLLQEYCYYEDNMLLFSIHNLDLVCNFSDTIIFIDKNRNLLSLENNHNITELENFFFEHCVV
uniref:ATP-binding cassette domain-containing protein n=1 Tax=Agathobacter sp. TaxID=2021311 RepID=UPI004056EA5F